MALHIRNFDRELHHHLKVVALLEHKQLGEMIQEILRAFLERRGERKEYSND